MSGAMPFRPEDFGLEEKFDRRQYEMEKLNRSWLFLFADFAVNTTVHGLRYLVEPTRYLCRKFVWILLIVISIGLFIYLIVTKLVLLFEHQTSISLDIRYNETVLFPAVTICNQSPFKLTSIQKLGLYDLLVNDNTTDRPPTNYSTCDEYLLYPGICSIPDQFSSGNILIGEVTRSVCLRFCSEVYDNECSSFVFNRTDNSCLLSAYTGDWLQPNAPNCTNTTTTTTNTTSGNNNEYSTIEFYRRRRCTDENAKIYCNFENDSKSCTFTNGSAINETWSLTTASVTSTITVDNTLNLASGHFQLMMTTDQRLGFVGRLRSPYINTTDRCLELFFWMDSSSDVPILSVIVVSEEKEETPVMRTYGKQTPGWIRVFVNLPGGINRIVVEGKRGSVDYSGIAVDDIFVQKCEDFKSDVQCRMNTMGTGYIGSMDKDSSGRGCLLWADVGEEYGALLPDMDIKGSRNYCRNILGPEAWSQPMCLVDQPTDKKSSISVLANCSIPFCVCRPETAFVCANGMCLPNANLLCDGKKDCTDGSDETGCANKTNISCNFEDGFSCGYVSTVIGALSWMRWKASDPIGLTQAPKMDSSGSVQGSYMLVSSVFGEVGDKVRLTSPALTVDRSTSLQFYYSFQVANSSDDTTQLKLYQLSLLKFRTQLLFSVTQSQGSKWFRAEVCLPNGTYSLAFVATIGLPFASDIAIDNIHLSDHPGCNGPPKPPTASANAWYDGPVNCSMVGICKYDFVSSSQNFEVTFKPNTKINYVLDGQCSQMFTDTEGYILSPDPCSLYGSRCNYMIAAPNGSTITLTFPVFDLVQGITCDSESLTIYSYNDDVSNWDQKAVLCGNNRPPKLSIKSRWLQLIYVPSCNHAYRRDGFNVSYKISYPLNTDLTMVLRMNTQTSGNANSSYPYDHISKLFSPIFQLNQPSCLVIEFVALTRFAIKLTYLNNSRYEERLLHRNIEGFQLTSSFYRLQRDIPLISSDRQEFVLVLEAKSKLMGDLVYINEILVLETSCPTLQSSLWSDDCYFEDGDTCGFIDQSDSGYSWVPYQGTYPRGMRCEFDGTSEAGTAVLLSPPFLVPSDYDSLYVFGYLESTNVLFNFSFIGNTTETPEVIFIAADDYFENAFISYVRLPNNSVDSILSLLITAYLRSTTSEYSSAYVLSIEFLNYKIADVGPPVSRSDDINCNTTVSSYSSCGFQMGANWGQTPAVVNNASVSRLSWYTCAGPASNNNPPFYFESAFITPAVATNVSVILEMSAQIAGSDELVLEVYRTSELGLVTYKMAEYFGNQSGISAIKDQLCLPEGNYRLVFVVNSRNYAGYCCYWRSFGTSCLSPVRIYGIELTEKSCTIRQPASSTECSSESKCLDQIIISQSTLLTKSLVAGTSITIDGDVLAVVLYDLTGTVNLMQNKETNVYLMGPTEFEVDLEVSMASWQTGCSTSDRLDVNVTVWTYISGVFMETKIQLLNFTSDGKYQTDNGIMQISLPLRAASCIQNISYHITPKTTDDYFLSISNRTYIYSYLPPEDLVSLWTSKVLTVEGGNHNLCFVLDMDLTISVVNVMLYEEGPTGTISNRRIFASGSESNKRIFSRIPVTLRNETFRFQFQANFTNALMIRQIKILRNSCPEDESMNGSCLFQPMSICGYADTSTQQTHWVFVTEQAQLKDPSGAYSDYSTRDTDCSSYADGSLYIGEINRTISGRTCQRWDSQTPHIHPFNNPYYFADMMSDSDVRLAEVENYCRNPSFSDDFLAAPYCYTTDLDVEWEYCLIPYCQNSFIEAVFTLTLDSATLLSPVLNINHNEGGYSLQFAYRLSHPKIRLQVQTMSSENSPWQTKEQDFTFDKQNNSSDWNMGCLQLDGQIYQIAFVADKIGFTQVLESAALGNITLTKGQVPRCSTQDQDGDGGSKPNNIEYQGPRLPRISYTEIVIGENDRFRMDELQIMMGHAKDDLIFGCTWAGQRCNDSDVILEQTDLAVCYTFNSNSSNRILSANNTGANDGLQLVLNIEQYENVPGFGMNRGVKMHFRSQDDVPQVLDAGLLIPPGYQTLALLEYSESKSLQKPWGRCSSKPYNYFNSFDPYTTAKCQLECKTAALLKQCHCIDPYMPTGPSKVCNFSSYLTCAREWTDNGGRCDCPDDCEVHSFTTSLSFSQFSNEVVDRISARTGFAEDYWNALETSNRVDDTLLRLSVESLMEVVDNHQTLLDLTLSTVVDPSTSTINLVLAAVTSLVEMAKGDMIDSANNFLSSLQRCYDNYVDQLVQSVSGQLQSCSDGFSKAIVLLLAYPNTPDNFSSILDSIECIRVMDAILGAADGAFEDAAGNYNCPANCLGKRCASLKNGYDYNRSNYYNIINSLVSEGIRYLNGTLKSTAPPTSPRPANGTTIYNASLSPGPSSLPPPTNGTKPMANSSNTDPPRTTKAYQMSTVGAQSAPPAATFSSTSTTPSPATDWIASSYDNGYWLREANALFTNTRRSVNQLSDCVCEYRQFLKDFGDCLKGFDLTVSSVDMTIASSAVKTLSQDSEILKRLRDDYLKKRITKRYLAEVFLTDLSSTITFHVDAVVSSLDSSVITEVTSIIGSTEEKLATAYGELMKKLALLQSDYLPTTSTAADEIARNLAIWKRPNPALQDKKLTSFQLKDEETYRTWPRATDLVTFTNGKAKDVVRKLLGAYDAVLKQTVSNVQTQLRSAQQTVANSVAKLRDSLLEFNDSTAIDEKFASNNIIKVDVFYGEMKYRTIEQSRGYDSIQFLSDFGGCFGLFLGGSVLSVFEFFDLFIYNVILKLGIKKVHAKQVKVRPMTPDYYP